MGRIVISSYHIFDQEKEHFYVIALNRANRVKFIDLISIGSAHGTIAEARELFRWAILKNASSLILAHNHPSGISFKAPE